MSEDKNLYAPPQANVADPTPEPSETGFIEGGRTAPMSAGARWVRDAMVIFFGRPLKWLVVVIVLCALLLVLSLVPVVNLFTTFLVPILGAGIAYLAEAQRRTGNFAIGDVFKGFGAIGQLLLIGAVMLAGSIIIGVCMVAFMGFEGLAELMAGGAAVDPQAVQGMLANLWRGLLLGIALSIPITAATYFAPVLVMLHGMTAFDAMKNSFFGTFKNILSGLVFFVVMFLLMIVSLIPIGLGLLISVPVLMLSTYAAYRGIFIEEGA
jgi:uncharacterized membrane protein